MTRHAPGVGKNLQDHFMVRFAYRTRPCGTLNEIMANPVRAAGLGLGCSCAGGTRWRSARPKQPLRPRPAGSEEPEVQFQFVNFSLGDQGGLGSRSRSIRLHLPIFCACRPTAAAS